jgi:hypothetical protein
MRLPLSTDAKLHGGGGEPARIVGQKYPTNLILPGQRWTSVIGALIPDLSEGKALSGVEGKESESAEHRLPSEPAPDHPPAAIGDSEISYRFSAHQVQRHRYLADIGDFEHQRHRCALTNARRCLQSQTEGSTLRRRLSGSSARQALA